MCSSFAMDSESIVYKDYFNLWFGELGGSEVYKEPILSDFTLDKVKLFCYSLQQDTHVFLMAVDVLERYISTKNLLGLEIEDPLLYIITIIYLTGKQTGDLSGFKTETLIDLYVKLTQRLLTNGQIKTAEIDILMTLDHTLPLHTKIDDMNLFLQYYQIPDLDVDFQPLCEEILNFYVVNSLRIFNRIKLNYMKKQEALNAFVDIYSKRLYLPIGIFLSAIKMSSRLRTILHYKTIVLELSELSFIHEDHLNILAKEIYNSRKELHKQL
ncbi:PREDICTED: uncharacterized protein LOC108556973 [Nicrophorus vespilloides]|uniref:Uncharacterized protein LOC108556973 n=1 Tax=Nicrophorus vespilloides TaxID=110193 RepID=A0ABM1M2M2_NICVS|nr:PREDICTED: uncharacterized protein LOC108556973 [Nicrophorus vespilloides]